jgi:GDP-4-dehydro-6-deoxy-D-mannose reductase
MRILITGANGFSGRHLVEYLSAQAAIDLYLTDIQTSEKTNYFSLDLADYQAVKDLIQKIEPQQIYHLAGSFSNDYTLDYQVNVLSTRHILESILISKINCRVLLIGSAAEYGQTLASDNPVKETQARQAISVYGLTKNFQTQLMDYYFRNFGLDLVMARPFNLLGEGISSQLLVGNLYRQLADYQANKINKIKLGNLSTQRDYISIDLAVADYFLLMNWGKSGEVYNVGSGKPILTENLVKNILQERGLSLDIVDYQMGSPTTNNVSSIYADISKINALKAEIGQGS